MAARVNYLVGEQDAPLRSPDLPCRKEKRERNAGGCPSRPVVCVTSRRPPAPDLQTSTGWYEAAARRGPQRAESGKRGMRAMRQDARGGGGDEKGGRHSACTTQTPLQHVLHASSCAKSPITPCPHLGAATLNISRVGNSPAPIVSRIASVTPPSLSPAPYPAEQNKMRWQCFGNRHGNLAYQLEIVVREVFRCIHDSNASSPQDIHLGAKRAECFSSPLRHRGDMSRFLLT